MISSINKISKQKCSAKADILVDGFMCTLKVRGFFLNDRDPSSSCAIEFQRRCGSCTAFQKAYDLVREVVQSDNFPDGFDTVFIESAGADSHAFDPHICNTGTEELDP